MRVLITGAGGFIGQLLAQALLNQPANSLLLTDIIEPPIPANVKYPRNASTLKGEISEVAAQAVRGNLNVVFVLHGIMSEQSETNFELGMRVNVDGTRKLLDALRKAHPKGSVRVIYMSSQAVYGGEIPVPVDESARPTPESSYGAEKLMCEALITDYTRRGFIDGIILRLPNVAIRPGKPSAAAGAFISGIIREPLAGKECIIPLRDRSYATWTCSPKTLVANLIHTLKVPRTALPPYDRVINMPGKGVTIHEMFNILMKVGGKEKVRLVREVQDPAKEKILRSWPIRFDHSRAFKLGYVADNGFEEAAVEYKKSLA